MGIAFASIEYLSERGYLPTRRSRLLDLGTQNLYHLSLESAQAFARKHGGISDEAAFAKAVEPAVLKSQAAPSSGWLSEIIDLTNVEYTSFDVCAGLKTEILDLNREDLPEKYREYFDVVLNFGTTEHIFNQLNSYRLMHDALSSGGVFFHQVPTLGYVDHGYFCYHSLFFKDLALANDYEILDMWYCTSGGFPVNATIDVRDPLKPGIKNSAAIPADAAMPLSAVLNVVMRKKRSSPFRVALELETSHSALNEQVATMYQGDPAPRPASPPDAMSARHAMSTRHLVAELGRRVRARLGV
jgi:SAM-dependent methyltransferase